MCEVHVRTWAVPGATTAIIGLRLQFPVSKSWQEKCWVLKTLDRPPSHSQYLCLKYSPLISVLLRDLLPSEPCLEQACVLWDPPRYSSAHDISFNFVRLPRRQRCAKGDRERDVDSPAWSSCPVVVCALLVFACAGLSSCCAQHRPPCQLHRVFSCLSPSRHLRIVNEAPSSSPVSRTKPAFVNPLSSLFHAGNVVSSPPLALTNSLTLPRTLVTYLSHPHTHTHTHTCPTEAVSPHLRGLEEPTHTLGTLFNHWTIGNQRSTVQHVQQTKPASTTKHHWQAPLTPSQGGGGGGDPNPSTPRPPPACPIPKAQRRRNLLVLRKPVALPVHRPPHQTRASDHLCSFDFVSLSKGLSLRRHLAAPEPGVDPLSSTNSLLLAQQTDSAEKQLCL